MSNNMLQITLTRSVIGRPKKHKVVVDSLGLRKINQTVQLKDTPEVRGMINKVCHLLTVEEDLTPTKKQASEKALKPAESAKPTAPAKEAGTVKETVAAKKSETSEEPEIIADENITV